MCKHLYEQWCEKTLCQLDQNMHLLQYLDPLYGNQNMCTLATILEWSCECNEHFHIEVPTFIEECCDNMEEVVNDTEHIIICMTCGNTKHHESHSFKDRGYYFQTNGNIHQKTFYQPIKNFKKFLTYFMYPITIFISKDNYNRIQEFCTPHRTSMQLFQFLKKIHCSVVYEFIPRLLQHVEVKCLTVEEEEEVVREYEKFCHFYSTFRKTQSRKSLPHRGFLFLKICNVLGIERFNNYVRQPTLSQTVHNLNLIWNEFMYRQ